MIPTRVKPTMFTLNIGIPYLFTILFFTFIKSNLQPVDVSKMLLYHVWQTVYVGPDPGALIRSLIWGVIAQWLVHLHLMLEAPGLIPGSGEKISVSEHAPLASFAGMNVNKCTFLWIGMLTGGPLCRKSHPLCRLKTPTVIYMITV